MEYVRGESLGARLRRERMAPEQVLDIGIQLTDSLVKAHRHGVVHRDLKPGNVCLTPEGRVKVLDVGLAKMRPVQYTEVPGDGDPASLYPPLSQAGTIFGTPGYMAPEQLRGKTVDNRRDLYSLGVLLFKLCTGRRSFEASEPLGTALACLTEPTPLAADVEPMVPADLSAIIGRAMAKEPVHRYQSVESMRSDLRNLATVHSERPTGSISSTGRDVGDRTSTELPVQSRRARPPVPADRPPAAAVFRRVTELLPESARGFQMLGAVYQALGELQAARENYERTLQLGELPSTYSNIDLLHYADGNFADAAKAFERARDLSLSDFRVCRNLGDVYQQLGQTEQAQAEYQRGVELTVDLVKVNPTDPTQLGQLAVFETLVG